MRRTILFISFIAFASAPASAQVRIRPVEPQHYMQLSVGLLSLGAVYDGSTGSTWDFGSGSTMYRATIEKSLQGGSAVGFAGGYAPVGLVYSGPACGGCDASAQIWQALAFFHNGAGIGFHQVIELTLGSTIYSNFRAKSGGAKLSPTSDADLSFSFAYGFGFGLSPGTDLEIIQEIGDGMHQKTNQPANASSLNRIGVTRLGVRLGL